jgi:hypothetical protein
LSAGAPTTLTGRSTTMGPRPNLHLAGVTQALEERDPPLSKASSGFLHTRRSASPTPNLGLTTHW